MVSLRASVRVLEGSSVHEGSSGKRGGGGDGLRAAGSVTSWVGQACWRDGVLARKVASDRER